MFYSKVGHLREKENSLTTMNVYPLFVAVFLYYYPDCSSCRAHLNRNGWATWAMWATIQKYTISDKFDGEKGTFIFPGIGTLLCILTSNKKKDLFIGPQEFVVGYSKAPEQPQSSARPIFLTL